MRKQQIDTSYSLTLTLYCPNKNVTTLFLRDFPISTGSFQKADIPPTLVLPLLFMKIQQKQGQYRTVDASRETYGRTELGILSVVEVLCVWKRKSNIQGV